MACSSATFAVKLYGDLGARLLAETWTDRMNAFYAMSLDGGDGHNFNVEEIASIANSREFEAARLQSSGKARIRFDAVAQLAPQSVR